MKFLLPIAVLIQVASEHWNTTIGLIGLIFIALWITKIARPSAVFVGAVILALSYVN